MPLDLQIIPVGEIDARIIDVLGDPLGNDLSLGSSLGGIGTLSGQISAIAPVMLSGGVSGAGAILGTMSTVGQVLLSGGIVSSGVLGGTVSQLVAFSGGVTGRATLGATLSQAVSLSGGVTGAATLSGGMSVAGSVSLSGGIVSSGVMSGTLSQAVSLAGGIVSSGIAAGTMTRTNNLSGGIVSSGVLAGIIGQSLNFTGGVVSSGILGGTLTQSSIPTLLLAVAGQSNGISKATNGVTPPTNIQAIDASRVFIWGSSSFSGYVAGTNSSQNGSFTTAWGPEAEFLRKWLVDNPIGNAYVVKNAEDGIRLAQDTGRDWHPNSSGEAFAAMTTKVTAAKAALVALSRVPHVDVMWIGNESDALVQTYADAAQDNLTTLISAIRTQWGDSTTKVAISRIYTTNLNPGGPTVRAAQNNVAVLDPLVYLTNTDDLTLFDTYHYNSTGVVTMGSRLYDALVSGTTIEVASLSGAVVSSGVLGGALSVAGSVALSGNAVSSGVLSGTMSQSVSLTGAAVSSGLLAGALTVSGTEDAATTAFFDAIATAGLTAPPTGWRAAYDQLIKDAKGGTDPWWNSCDVIYVLGSYDAAVARRNLKQDAFHATTSASPSFTAKTGYLCTSGKLQTGFNPATAGGSYAQNSAHVMFGTATDVAATASDIHNWTGSAGVFINCRTAHTPNKTEGRLNTSANFTIQPGSTSSAHHWVFNRTSSTQILAYQEGTLWQTFTSTSSAVASFAFEIGALGTTYTTRRYDRASIGGGLTAAQIAQQETNFNTFFTATAGL